MLKEARVRRRVIRRAVLRALLRETGSMGGRASASRVSAFLSDPVGASKEEFRFVGGLPLCAFYFGAASLMQAERYSLMEAVACELDVPIAGEPGGWDSKVDVAALQSIVEEAAVWESARVL